MSVVFPGCQYYVECNCPTDGAIPGDFHDEMVSICTTSGTGSLYIIASVIYLRLYCFSQSTTGKAVRWAMPDEIVE